jgi:hypothetical protein
MHEMGHQIISVMSMVYFRFVGHSALFVNFSDKAEIFRAFFRDADQLLFPGIEPNAMGRWCINDKGEMWKPGTLAIARWNGLTYCRALRHDRLQNHRQP